MCGITYVRANNAVMKVGQILEGQASRGSTSCGLAFINEGELKTIKQLGDAHKFKDFLNSIHPNENIQIALGHNRMPSVGSGANKNNIHPFVSCDNSFALVHNGTLSTDILRNFFIISGHKIKGFTDSEVITHLLEEVLIRTDNNRALAFDILLKILNGGTYSNYAILVLFKDGELWGVRNSEPIRIVKKKNKVFIASEDEAFYKIDDLVGRTVNVLEPLENKPFSIRGIRVKGEFEKEKITIEDSTPKACKNCKIKDYLKCKEVNQDCPYDNKKHKRDFGDYPYNGLYQNNLYGAGTYMNRPAIKPIKEKEDLKPMKLTKQIKNKLKGLANKITSSTEHDDIMKKQTKFKTSKAIDSDDQERTVKEAMSLDNMYDKIIINEVKFNRQPIGFKIFLCEDNKYESIEKTYDLKDAKEICIDFVKGFSLIKSETLRIIPAYLWDEYDNETIEGMNDHKAVSRVGSNGNAKCNHCNGRMYLEGDYYKCVVCGIMQHKNYVEYQRDDDVY